MNASKTAKPLGYLGRAASSEIQKEIPVAAAVDVRLSAGEALTRFSFPGFFVGCLAA